MNQHEDGFISSENTIDNTKLNELFTGFLDKFDELDSDSLAKLINSFIFDSSIESGESSNNLEKRLYQFLFENYKDDERFEFVKTEVGGAELEFVTIKSLLELDSFTTPVIPFLRKNPDESYMGFHDTTNYFAQELSTNGIDPKFGSGEFYVHSKGLMKSYWNRHFLYRLLHYGKTRNSPESLAVNQDTLTPQKVRETDFRSARLAVILPKILFFEGNGENEKSIDFTNGEDNVPYEFKVKGFVPVECIKVTNIYHPYFASEEIAENGYVERSEPFLEEQERVAAFYKKYGISLKTGVKEV